MLLQRLMRSSVAVVAALWTFAAAADESGLVHPRTGVERSPATAGDVPLRGDLDGNLLVLDARNGKEVSRFNTGGPIAGGIVTYQKAVSSTLRWRAATTAAQFRCEAAQRS